MVVSKGGAKAGIPMDAKLVALRQQMAAADGGAGVDAYIIPSEDPHMVGIPSHHKLNIYSFNHLCGALGR